MKHPTFLSRRLVDANVPGAGVDGEGGRAIDDERFVECVLSGEQCCWRECEHRERNCLDDDCSAKIHDGSSVSSEVTEC